mgnify:CR=1 FL=1
MLHKNKHPEAAQHIEDAQKEGHPCILTINRSGTIANRKAALEGKKKVPDKQLDEYPPAMFKEGGKGASVRAISPKDNQGMGATIGNQLRKYPDGTKVKLTIIN